MSLWTATGRGSYSAASGSCCARSPTCCSASASAAATATVAAAASSPCSPSVVAASWGSSSPKGKAVRRGSSGRRRGSGSGDDSFFLGSAPYSSSGGGGQGRRRGEFVPGKARAQQSGAAAREPAEGDGALAFPLFSKEFFKQWWWPMRSRTSMDGYKRAASEGTTISEAERARAITAYLTYEPPSSLAAYPPWHFSLPHVCVATISAILFGYHLGVVNIPLGVIASELGFAGDTIAQGSVVSACLVGAFIGCSIAGSVADKHGRKRTFQFSTVPMISGALLSSAASNLSTMLLGRFLVGFGLGVSGPVTSLYVSEVSPTNVRGTLGSLIQVATCIGILASILVGLPVNSIQGWWRACFWLSTIPAAALAVGMMFCAESPRWLFKQSRWAEAERELGRLWGTPHAKGAMADLVRADDETGDAPWSALWDRKYFKVVVIGATLFGFQQLAGINAVFYFSSVVFRNAGVASEVAASVYMGIINLAASFVAAALMDRQGRRSLLIFSFGGMAIAMALQAAAAGLAILAPYQGNLSLLATLGFVFTFALGAGPVPALLLPEIFASRIRAKAMSVAMCVHWVANFLVGLLFLQLLQQLGPSVVYSFFSIVCLAAVLFVVKNVQETKGRSLEEIEALLLADL